MTENIARKHHYAPQFFLRNFSADDEKRKINVVSKSGAMAIWHKCSIKRLGFERDLYVHMQGDVPISVESDINEDIETPVSRSETWAKIASEQTAALDRKDKPILYSLIRHLEARSPHRLQTTHELAHLAASGDRSIPFTDDERDFYSQLNADPNQAKVLFNSMASSLKWSELAFLGAGLSIFRSPIPLRSSTTPVIAIRAPSHPGLRIPLPGIEPYQLLLTLNRHTCASLVLGDFDDAFENREITSDEARGLNRHFLAQFTYFSRIQHLITGRDALIDDMQWAGYELVSQEEKRIKFVRRGKISDR